MKNIRKELHGYGLLGLLLVVGQAHAQSVNWGGSVSENPLSFDSYGNPDIGVMVWELGYFNDAYDPATLDYATWADNWNSVDVGAFIDYGGVFSASEVVTDPDSAAEGKVMYTFVHNGGSSDTAVWGPLMGTAAGEALLYTTGLLFQPVLTPAQSFNIANDPFDATDDDAFSLIWGRVDRNLYLDADWGSSGAPAGPPPSDGGVIRGDGIISNLIPDSQATPYGGLTGTFENQTATWAIPEPSVALLSGLGLLLMMRRRR